MLPYSSLDLIFLQCFIVDLNKVTHENEDSLYLCGHSLGLMPKEAQTYIDRELDKWKKV